MFYQIKFYAHGPIRTVTAYIFFFLLLTGSTFIASTHFVNVTNAPKYYFFATAIFMAGIIGPWITHKACLPGCAICSGPAVYAGSI